MIRKLVLVLFTIIFLTGSSYSQTLTVDTLVNNGNPANRINLVFLGDGYTVSQQTQYITDVNVIIEKMFNTTPFKEYKSFFNVYAIHVISTESGAKHPNTALDCNTANPQVPVSSPNTALSATFDYGSTHRLLYCTNTSAINNILQQNFPLYDKGLIVVNTPYYGGSGGTYSICSTDPSSAEIMIHELGHSFADLGDEYGGSYCSGSERPNVTTQTNPALVKWKDWIQTGMPVPTTNGTNCGSYPSLNIGLYQGANYCNTGWYRPACNCKMNMLGTPFCNVCNQTLVYCINNSISLIDGYQPSGAVTLSNGQIQMFSASFLTPSQNSILKTWKLDNTLVATNVNSYQVDGNTITDGTHTLVLTATDSTHRSKVTMPVYTKTWIITKNGSVTVTLLPFNAVCANTPDFSLTGGSPSGGVYSGTGVSNGKFSPITVGAGTYTITYTYGGVASTQSITVKSLPDISTSENTTICNGSNTTLSASGASTYTWSPNISLNSSTGATVIASPAVNQAYSVTGTSNGCTNSKTIFIFVTSLPNITVSSNTSICAGNSTTLTASGGSTYVWLPSTGLSASTGSSVSASPALSVTYTVTGTSGSCSKSQTVSVSVQAAPNVTVTSNTSICAGGSTTLSANGASTYSWEPLTDLSATSGASVVSTPTQSITYTVTGTYNGCSKSQTVAVSVNTRPTIVISGETSICNGASGVLTASGATTYVWAPSAGLSATTGTSVSAAPTANITYTVTGLQGGCQNNQTVSVMVKPTPVISVSSNTSVCAGGKATLTSDGASEYLWMPYTSLSNSTGYSVESTPSVTTIYSVTGTTNGCSQTKSISVSVNPLPNIAENNNLPSCSGGANGSIDITVTGQSPFTYQWSDGNSTEDNINLIQGNYTVTATSATGCIQIKDFTIVSLSCAAITKNAITDIKSSSARLNWGQTPCSYAYQIRQRQVGMKKWKYYMAQMQDSAFTFNNLLPGVSYECQIMSYCKSDFSDSSDYSAMMTYTTLSNCFVPATLLTENILSNSAVLKWSGAEAVSYRVRIKEDTSNTWQAYRVRNAKTELIINNLKASTTYVWQIRSNCSNGSENDHSNYSTFQTFTTLHQPPRIAGDNVTEPNPSDGIQLYPNPSNGKFLINAAKLTSEKIEITVTDVFGKVFIDNIYPAEEEFKEAFDISGLPAGVYFVRIHKGSDIINRKITKQ